MGTNKGFLGTLMLILMGMGPVSAQGTGSGYGAPTSPAVPDSGTPPAANTSTHGPAKLSSWIIGTDCDCCGELGDHMPIKNELFIRSGFSFIGGSGQLADSLDTGWMIEGGGRVLCFNGRGDMAWTLEGSLSNIHNSGTNPPPQVTFLNIPASDSQGGLILQPTVVTAVKALNRTFVSAGVGQEWYMFGAATGTRSCDNALWRVGWDVGGRYGSAKLELTDIRHRTDVIGAAYLALHTDIDIPWGCCVFQVGLRAEYDYTWSDVLQLQNKSDLEGYNLLFNVGVRY